MAMRMRGCRMASSARRASSFANTCRRNEARSRPPSGNNTSGPNNATISARAGCPGSTTSRAARSASITAMPFDLKRSATALLPEAMPPVSPIANIGSLQAGQPQVTVDERLAPEERDPARDGEIGAERDRRRAVAALRGQPRRTDDRAHDRRQQDRRQDALQPDPRADGGEQLEVAVAHAFLAGDLLEDPVHRPEREVAGHDAEQRRLLADVEVLDRRDQPEPQQGQRQLVRQESRAQVDARERDEEAGEQHRAETAPAEAELPHAGQHHQHRDEFDERVLRRDRRVAMAALAAQGKPAQERDVLVPGELVFAVRTVRRLDHDAGGRRVVGLGLAEDLAAVALPLPFQPPREAEDDDVEEAAEREPEGGRGGIAEAGVLVQERHLARRQTTAASLKIGRYMATTMLPTITPSITTMIGSSRLASASTALLTSCS